MMTDYHSEEDGVFYKTMCWVFSLILALANFQDIKVKGTEDINIFPRAPTLWLIF